MSVFMYVATMLHVISRVVYSIKYFKESILLYSVKLCYYHLQATVRRQLFYALFYALNVHVWQTKHALLN